MGSTTISFAILAVALSLIALLVGFFWGRSKVKSRVDEARVNERKFADAREFSLREQLEEKMAEVAKLRPFAEEHTRRQEQLKSEQARQERIKQEASARSKPAVPPLEVHRTPEAADAAIQKLLQSIDVTLNQASELSGPPMAEAQRATNQTQKPINEAPRPVPESQRPINEAPMSMNQVQRPMPEPQRPTPEPKRQMPEPQRPIVETPRPVNQAQRPVNQPPRPLAETQKPVSQAQRPTPEPQSPVNQTQRPMPAPQRQTPETQRPAAEAEKKKPPVPKGADPKAATDEWQEFARSLASLNRLKR